MKRFPDPYFWDTPYKNRSNEMRLRFSWFWSYLTWKSNFKRRFELRFFLSYGLMGLKPLWSRIWIFTYLSYTMFIVNIIFFEFVIPSNDYEYYFRKYLVKLLYNKKLNTNFKRTLLSLQKKRTANKVIYPKYSKNWHYLLAMNCSPVNLVQDLESFHLIHINISHIRRRQVTTIECSWVYF